MIRQRIAVHKKRPDGRSETEIRPIATEVGLLPRTHGSALFTRGQTQALSVVALGTTREEMRLDNLGLETSKRYFHHYNFPPFSVGEAGFMRGPKRRDIGHGALAERALVPMIPSQEEFPYTIRVVSDILESNGSSSMASVCGSSLSLMDAGVPLKAPVAGVAMGLIKEGDDYTVLTDIAGVEDHLGDMDFKVAGTENGHHRPPDGHQDHGRHVRDPARRARPRRARAGCTSSARWPSRSTPPRGELSSFAPRISTIQIDPDKIGLLIGKGGETIRGLCDEFDAQIDVDDEGNVLVYAQTGAQGDALIDRIRSMTKEVEVGDEFADGEGRQDHDVRRVRRARQGHRRPAAHLQRVARPAGRRRSRRSSTRATRSRSAWSRSTRSAAASACASPRTRTIAGKTEEELAAVGAGADGGGGGRGDRGPRRDGRGRAATAAAAAAATATASGARAATATPTAASARLGARAPAHDAGLGAAGRHGAHELRPVRGPRASSWARARAASSPRRPGSRTSSSTCCSAAPTASRRRRSTSCSTAWAPSSTPAPTRRPRRSTRGCSTSTCRAPST